MTKIEAIESLNLWQSITAASGSQTDVAATDPIATLLGFDRFAFLPTTLYTTPDDNNNRVFDAAKLAHNADTIREICRGKKYAVMNMEGRQRWAIVHTNHKNLKPGELYWAFRQFKESWAAMRKIVPDILLGEWGWSAQSDDSAWLLDLMVVEYLDFLSPSCFWKDVPGHAEVVSDRMAHASALGFTHNMPVISWIWERQVQWNADRTVRTFRLLSPEGRSQMLDFATFDVLGMVVWSHTLWTAAGANPTKVIPETLDPNYKPADIYAPLAVLLGETQMRQ